MNISFRGSKATLRETRGKYEYEKSEEMEEVRMGRYRKQAFVVRKISISSPGDIYGMVLIYFTPRFSSPLAVVNNKYLAII